MTALLQRVADAKVPIGIWVGPSRASRAYGLPAQLMAVADVTAMVGGSRIGYIGTPLIVDGRRSASAHADRSADRTVR